MLLFSWNTSSRQNPAALRASSPGAQKGKRRIHYTHTTDYLPYQSQESISPRRYNAPRDRDRDIVPPHRFSYRSNTELPHLTLGSGNFNSVKSTPIVERIVKTKTRHIQPVAISPTSIGPPYPSIIDTAV